MKRRWFMVLWRDAPTLLQWGRLYRVGTVAVHADARRLSGQTAHLFKTAREARGAIARTLASDAFAAKLKLYDRDVELAHMRIACVEVPACNG